MRTDLKIIVALDELGGFSKNGKIPWIHLDIAKQDLRHFKELTTNGACVMGRRTYDDMCEIKRSKGVKIGEQILPGRNNYVLTSNTKLDTPGAIKVHSLREALDQIPNDQPVWILGGYRVWIQALPQTSDIHVTLFAGNFECDKHFPVDIINRKYIIIGGEAFNEMSFIHYKRTSI